MFLYLEPNELVACVIACWLNYKTDVLKVRGDHGDGGYAYPTFSYWRIRDTSSSRSDNSNAITYRDEARECINIILRKGNNLIYFIIPSG